MTHNDNGALEARATAYLTGILSEVIKLPADRIDIGAAFDSLGMDSVLMMRMTTELEAALGSLPKTLFFEFRDLRALTRHLLGTHGPELARLLGVAPARAPETAPVRPRAARDGAPRGPLRTDRWATRFDPPAAAPAPAPELAASEPAASEPAAAPRTGLDIAIIGLAGRYPQARTVDEFWANLAAGRDSVTEIPADRWDHSGYFDADRDAPGKTYSKWGGFLDGVDEFDSLFFHISPPEAKLMDPQERLFLQTVYETVEDAAYTPDRLNAAGNVGVYVGVMYEEYQLYGAQEQALGNPVALSGNASAVANRVSYYFDFHGPSMSVDTMCSSSFTAIHLACQSLESGACDVAVAGGVNLSVHPNKYLMLGQGKFVSSKGRCESFGAGGDGYVPGEGVGAVLLKPLAKAIADGDRIHGVIKGVAINHGGRTTGYSVPSPQAQARSITDAWRQAGIDPRKLSYIEAHGTGTTLGDPVEIAGLTKAFRDHTADNQFCAIGSVKSNIGHAESAAGISGLTKVLLQMRHRKLAPSLHAIELNPHIDFAATPFTVQRELVDWDTGGTPRLAGVSSFGAGGSNAHLVVEEYRTAPAAPVASGAPVAVLLSAGSPERLRVKAANLAAWIEARNLATADLPSLAYTSQVGREAMRERLGIVVDSMPGLLARLRAGLADPADGLAGRDDGLTGRAPGVFRGRAAVNAGDAGPGDLATVLDAWVGGAAVDWAARHDGPPPPRIALPAYPFARERHWVDLTRATAEPLVFEEFWAPEPAAAALGAGLRTLVCLGVGPADRAELERVAGPGWTLVFVPREPAGWVAAFAELGPVDAILNLLPLTEGVGPQSYPDTVRLLQAVAAAKLDVRRIVQAGVFRDGTERAYAESWLGFERSLGRVLPSVRFAAVLADGGGTNPADWFERLATETTSVLYRDAKRHVSRVRPAPAGSAATPLKRGGRYLITGGLGALGQIFAEHLTRTWSARLVLTGRSPLDADRIAALGDQVLYVQADVTDRQDMRAMVVAARERFGGIDGVIHAAGVPGTGSVLTNDAGTFPGLLAAKVDGTLVLDEVLTGETSISSATSRPRRRSSATSAVATTRSATGSRPLTRGSGPAPPSRSTGRCGVTARWASMTRGRPSCISPPAASTCWRRRTASRCSSGCSDPVRRNAS